MGLKMPDNEIRNRSDIDDPIKKATAEAGALIFSVTRSR